MKKYLNKFGSLSSAARLYISITALLLVTTAITIYSASVRQEKRTFAEYSFINLLSNSGFEADKSSWIFYTNGSGSFVTGSPAYEGVKSAKVSLTSVGTNMQLYQANVSLEPNTKYRLTFSAYSSTGHDINVGLLKHSSPYTNYGLSSLFDLTTSWQTFTKEFTTSGFSSNVADGRFRFYFPGLASTGDVYYIDGIKLEKIIESSVSTPVFSPSEGTYSSPQTVSISSLTSGVTIYYTTDNSTPTTSSTVYTSPITISTATTLKAMAVKSGYGASLIGSGVYDLLDPDTPPALPGLIDVTPTYVMPTQAPTEIVVEPTLTPVPTYPDTIKPKVSIISPENGTKVPKRSNIMVTAYADDDRGISQVIFYRESSLSCIIERPTSDKKYSCKMYTGKPNDKVNYKVEAFDAEGNFSTSYSSVIVK